MNAFPTPLTVEFGLHHTRAVPRLQNTDGQVPFCPAIFVQHARVGCGTWKGDSEKNQGGSWTNGSNNDFCSQTIYFFNLRFSSNSSCVSWSSPTGRLAHVVGKYPVDRLLGVRPSDVELAKVGHVEDRHAIPTCPALAANLKTSRESRHTVLP